MIITPTMLAGLGYAGPVVVSTLVSFLVGRSAARRCVEQFKQELTGSTTSAVQGVLTSRLASAGPIEERITRSHSIERSRSTAQTVLEMANEVNALTREAVDRPERRKK